MDMTLKILDSSPPADTPDSDDIALRVLVLRACDDSNSFVQLYDRFWSRVYNYARYRVDDAQTADDMTAQIFERVQRYLRSYRPEQGSFEPWLFTIARTVISNYHRSQRRRRWLPWEILRHHPSDSPLPESEFEAQDQRTQLLRAVADLESRERDIIALRFGSGLSNRQIAATTGLSDSHVGVILHRALRKLRQRLQSRD